MSQKDPLKKFNLIKKQPLLPHGAKPLEARGEASSNNIKLYMEKH